MALTDYFLFSWAIFLIVLGLIFSASGFGILVVGRLDGFIIITVGVTMFWGGWIQSGARGFPCAAAALLNMVDTASTVAFWNFEINPVVFTLGPTVFMIAKIMSSLAIMLYAKFDPNSRRGGVTLSIFFALIVGWNLSQHLSAYLGLKTFAYGILLGTMFSLLSSAIVLYTIFLNGHIKKERVKLMTNKLVVIGLISLLLFSMYLAWENNVINNYYKELHKMYTDLTMKYKKTYEETIFNLTLLMPKGLDEHYERIRMYESSKFINKGDSGCILFYTTQVLHDLGNYSYDHCVEFNKTVGIECKHSTVSFAINFLDYVNRAYSNISRLQQVYSWVNYFVSYVNDTNGFRRFPIETLVYRCGNSEDQAMALSFLLESCGYETALCTIHDKNLTKYGSEGLRHVFCVVRKNDFEYNGTLIQLHKYPEYGNSWIVLDPAFNQIFGRVPEWMDNYRIDNGTVYIPPAVWDALLVDYTEVVIRAKEIGITRNK